MPTVHQSVPSGLPSRTCGDALSTSSFAQKAPEFAFPFTKWMGWNVAPPGPSRGGSAIQAQVLGGPLSGPLVANQVMRFG